MEVKQVKVTAAAAEAATSSWSELPADLIGQVLLRLPSLADRVRLRAACRPWRTDAKRQAALPPAAAVGVTDYLAVDNLAFLAHNRAACCSLVNPLSASEETPLPQLANAVLRAMNDSKFYTVGNTKMPYVKNAPRLFALANVSAEFKKIASTSCTGLLTIRPESTLVRVSILLATLLSRLRTNFCRFDIMLVNIDPDDIVCPGN
ncbi:hypothetical protein OsJ_36715 [Oryza sativa Japonica Group]|uniref:F-box domain-containing protein n=1 Tax=Oryza sativa subsp. japonica TaxID=39947 RepID=A3CJ09_ORYSJ|nr:hypothetical protein OsJ_36715 [Oryza sativa Japonica Group]